MDLKIVISSNP